MRNKIIVNFGLLLAWITYYSMMSTNVTNILYSAYHRIGTFCDFVGNLIFRLKH